MCLEKYEKILAAIESSNCQVIDNAEFETSLLKDTFGRRGLYEGILEENGENLLEAINLNQLKNQLPEIAAQLKKLPKSDEMKEKLKKADCIVSMKELNLPDIKELTLTLSPYVRRRLTLMRMSKLLRI